MRDYLRKHVLDNLILLFIFLPVIHMILKTVLKFLDISNLFTLRRMTLLFKTSSLSLTIALLCVILSYFIALKIYLMNKNYLSYIMVIFASMLLIPTSIHVMAWYNILDHTVFSGFLKSAIVLVLYYAPLGALVILMALHTIDRNYFDSARLYQNNYSLVFKMIPGMIKPYLVALFSLIMILTLSDFNIPSLFQYPTYSMEIFSEFSATNNAERTLLTALPLIVLSSLLMLLLLKNLNKITFKSSGRVIVRKDIIFSFEIKFITNLSYLLLVIHLMIILYSLFSKLSDEVLIKVVKENYDVLLYSIMISFISSFISTIFVIYISFKSKIIYKKLLLILLVIPAPIIGISIIFFFNQFTSYNILLNANMLLVYSNILRITPMIVLVTYGLFQTLDKETIECARVYEKKKFVRIKSIYLPMILPSFIVSVYVGFALSFSEVASSLLLVPPGKELVSLRIYSYLHYGSSENIVALEFLVIVIFTVISYLIYRLLFKKRRYFR